MGDGLDVDIESPDRIWIGERAKYLLDEEGSCLCLKTRDAGSIAYVRQDIADAQHAALISALDRLEQRAKFALTTPGLIKGRDALNAAVLAARDLLREVE